MRDATEVEIRVQRRSADPPAMPEVELRFSDPGNESELPPAFGHLALDLSGLRELELDPTRYGEALAGQLFASAPVRELFLRARATAASRGLGLRLRLALGAGCEDLQALRWELLGDPENGHCLTTSERCLFSRFLEVNDWRRVNALPRSELRTLVVVAAPTDLEAYRLTPIERDAEIARIGLALGKTPFRVLEPPITLDRLVEALRPGIDLLHFVGHGSLRQGEAWLFLEDEAGHTARVAGEALAQRIADLERPPRLVVLSSCESSDAGAEAALAPRLARAGVQALVAMQGKLSFATAEKFFPAFFATLFQEGRIDEAVAVARGAVRERPDSYVPVLFLRLKGGRLWNDAHFGGGKENDEIRYWDQLCRQVVSGRFIPILGSGLAGKVYRSHAETAAELTGQCSRFPLAAHLRQDLPRVLQYLRSTEKAVPHQVLKEQLSRQIRSRHQGLLSSELENAKLTRLMDEVGRLHRREPDDPYRILAGLPAKIYLQACYDNLLFRALAEQDKKPQRLLSNWRNNPPAVPLPAAEPSRSRPAIHYVFGAIDQDETLVLTEDDYFDFLITTSANRLMPLAVASALAGSSLIFLGLPLTDWCFRVLFRLILSLEGRLRRKGLLSVGVQVDPSLGEFSDAEEARSYLQTYFESEADISIYWGSSEDFLVQLRDKLSALPPEIAAESAVDDQEEGYDYND